MKKVSDAEMGYYADNELGKELKRLRKERNISQEEIAEYLHIARQTYSHYETGRIQPPFRSLFALKTFYNIPLSNLLKYMNIDSESVDIQSVQEEELISYFRKLPEKEQNAVFQMIRETSLR